MQLSEQQISMATGALPNNSAIYAPFLNAAMSQFGIASPRRIAAFLATVAVESGALRLIEESLYYKDAHRLASIYPRAFRDTDAAEAYIKNPRALSTLLYEGFHGRGLIQLTWRKNYSDAAVALGYPYVDQPELLLQPRHAALTAAWFWSANGCNEAADRGDMREVTRLVNGSAQMHLEERTSLYDKAIAWLA